MLKRIKGAWNQLSVFARTTVIGTIIVGLLTTFLSDAIKNYLQPNTPPKVVEKKPIEFRQAFVINCSNGLFRASMTIEMLSPGSEPPDSESVKELVERAKDEGKSDLSNGQQMTRSEVVESLRNSLPEIFEQEGLQVSLLEVETTDGEFETIDLPTSGKRLNTRSDKDPSINYPTHPTPQIPSPVTVIPPMATPFISPASGAYAAAKIQVTLSTFYDDAVIHFTTDGSNPSKDSPIYQSPVTIQVPATFKAVARKNDGSISPVGSATYTLVSPISESHADQAPPRAPTGLRISQ